MPQPNGGLHFREESKRGVVNYEVIEDIPNQRMVTRILDTNLGYSGKWTYRIANEGANTRLTVTEDAEVTNVIFRFMARYVFGYTASLESYLNSLAAKFGESAKPE